MKLLGVLALLLVASAVIADDSELVEAEPCTSDVECELPKCKCSNVEIPGGLLPRDTPQFITLTFDDGINVNNILTYREILYNHKNSNGCPGGATFYVSHEYTNYVLVNELYNRGFEIALHSISHQTPQTYWFEATIEDMRREFGDQKAQISHFANIPSEAIRGIRIPFLQMTGNASFEVIQEYGLEYDSSWPTVAQTNPGLWPYTLDYRSSQDCVVPPCPTASFPGLWVQPLVTWSDLQGVPCSFMDACFWVPNRDNEEEWYKFIVRNFERHYMGNRAPFGIYVHEWYLSAYPAIKRAVVRFMKTVEGLPDAFVVNAHEVLDWVKDPSPIDEYKKKPCRRHIGTDCAALSCGPLNSSHNGLDYWIQICNVCPSVYPWLGNPLGQ